MILEILSKGNFSLSELHNGQLGQRRLTNEIGKRLLILAKRFLTVQATSAESERSFSLSVQISTKLRANLSGVNLENLAFFKANDQLLQNDDVRAEVIVDIKDDSDPSVVTTSSYFFFPF